MPIDFSPQRWQRVKEVYRQWWAGRLDRPIMHVVVDGRDPGREPPAHPFNGITALYDLSVPADQVVDSWDYYLSTKDFLGDSYPTLFVNFGPGVMAAFIGAELRSVADTRTVWFHPPADAPIGELDFEYDPDNVWLRRIKDICRAAVDRWEGLVQLSMTDLGGALDVLSTFRPSEGLLLDLMDHPEDVKRLTWQIHELWWRYFDEIDAILRPASHGYTSWTPIFSETPSYMLQCDFCYMISPGMFDEFVKPELAASCRRLDNPFYHLDGPGELPHLDSLLTVPGLKGVQWIPGAGSADCSHWPQVYRKIRAAGKLVQVMDHFDEVVSQLGSPAGLFHHAGFPRPDRDRALDLLKRYRAQ